MSHPAQIRTSHSTFVTVVLRVTRAPLFQRITHLLVESMESLPERLKETADFAKSLPWATEAQAAIDGGVSTVVHELSKYASVAMEATSEYVETGRAHSGVALARLKEVDDEFFRRPTELLARAIHEQPYATCAVGGAIAALMLPGTRGLLWRASFGRMQSEEVRRRRRRKQRHREWWRICFFWFFFFFIVPSPLT